MNTPATTLLALILGLAISYPAVAQRRSDNGNERNDRGAFDEDRRNRRNSSEEERGSRASSDEDRGNRWQRWGGGNANWAGGNFNRSSRSDSRSGNGDGVFSEQYGIITDRNIFLRDRRSREPQQDFRARGGPPRTPEQTYVLTGVVFENDEFHAYMEDVTRRTIQKLTVGTDIARGRIAAIDIDAVAYESNGQVTWILVGSNLTGAAVGSVSEERVNAALWSGVGAAAAMPAPGAPLPDANNPNLTIEERMRLRRAMEMNPGAMLPSVPENTNGSEFIEQQGNEGFEQPQFQPGPIGEQPAPPQPFPGDGSGLSLEEQMRLRRQQELGR